MHDQRDPDVNQVPVHSLLWLTCWSPLCIWWGGPVELSMTRISRYTRMNSSRLLSTLSLTHSTIVVDDDRYVTHVRRPYVHASPTKRPDFRYRQPPSVISSKQLHMATALPASESPAGARLHARWAVNTVALAWRRQSVPRSSWSGCSSCS